MGERIIKIKPFEYLNFTKVSIYKNVNKHGNCEISGLISSEYADSVLSAHRLGSGGEVCVIDEKGIEEILFNGLIEDIHLENIGGSYILHLHLVSHSTKMDKKKYTRTFQNIGMTYHEVTGLMQDASGIGSFLVPEHSNTTIAKLLVQYEETDWEFSKRMASRLNTIIVSDFRLDSPYISVGLPATNKGGTMASTDFILGSDNLESFQNPSHDPTFYKVESRESYDIGTNIEFKGRALLVSKVESQLVGAQLIHTHTLRPKSGFITHEYYNENLIGASIIGNIEKVEKDLVQSKIQNDVTQSEYMWFSYATVYSSPDNTGWYFMPEIGDEVRLHFPTQREWESYVISSVHLGGRADADTKSIRTKWGKEIIFTPTSIYINNGAGSNILLDDDSGIKIESNKTVAISAEKNIIIDAMGKIDITGDKGVTISQAGNVIDVDEIIDINAEYVRVE